MTNESPGVNVPRLPGVSPGFGPPALRLFDGRWVIVDEVHIGESTAGIVYSRSAERVWELVANTPRTGMPGREDLPTLALPLGSACPDARVVPRWEIRALLLSESLEPAPGPFGGGSQLVLTFFCDDITSQPIIDVIGKQLISLDEQRWRQHAEDWSP